jgi:FkbM family methyltransferase
MGSNLIFDVGMHKGEDTDFYLAKGYRVIAFEADPDLAQECRARLSPAIANGHLIIVEGAISPPGSPPKVTFFKSLDNSVWGTTKTAFADRNARAGAASRAIEVDTVIFSEMFSRYGIPLFMKVDIEGADGVACEALKSANEPPLYISIESNKTSFEAVAEEINLLADVGYGWFMAVQQEAIPGTVITTTTIDGHPLRYQFKQHSSGPFGPDLHGKWMDKKQIMERYRSIYRDYARWGDDALFRRLVTGALLDRVGKAIGRPLPGWYDTHARRTEAV